MQADYTESTSVTAAGHAPTNLAPGYASMTKPCHRRQFLKHSSALVTGLAAARPQTTRAANDAQQPLYRISIAEYSFHRMIAMGKLDPLDFAPFARTEFQVDAVEHWMGPFANKARDTKYLNEMKRRADDAGVQSLLIMVDLIEPEQDLGDPDIARRKKAVENHYPWVEAARLFGCHSIRVNARSSGTYDEQLDRAADGLRQLAEFGVRHQINVIVENHGGLSSNGAWLAAVMRKVDLPNCGTLPDFGNFHLGDGTWYDRYQGVRELMPFAKAVSAKSHEFDESGNESRTDYRRMMKIVVDAGYHGYVGIEYEGRKHSEIEGTRLTQRLLERVRDELA
jgi:sugar phosphate isomerase/epimerase